MPLDFRLSRNLKRQLLWPLVTSLGTSFIDPLTMCDSSSIAAIGIETRHVEVYRQVSVDTLPSDPLRTVVIAPSCLGLGEMAQTWSAGSYQAQEPSVSNLK